MSLKKQGLTSSGFTLIELLVVIAIISILAAIMFPVFGRARENARRATCQSNIKQIALGFKQYTQDYDEKYPRADGPSGATADQGWAVALQPYVKSLQIYQCASEPTRPISDPTEGGYTDYAYNINIGEKGVSEASITHTANTILLFDSAVTENAGKSNWASGSDIFTTYSLPEPSTIPESYRPLAAAARRHLEGANYGFADGHVKWLRPTMIKDEAPTGSNATWKIN